MKFVKANSTWANHFNDMNGGGILNIYVTGDGRIICWEKFVNEELRRFADFHRGVDNEKVEGKSFTEVVSKLCEEEVLVLHEEDGMGELDVQGRFFKGENFVRVDLGELKKMMLKKEEESLERFIKNAGVRKSNWLLVDYRIYVLSKRFLIWLEDIHDNYLNEERFSLQRLFEDVEMTVLDLVGSVEKGERAVNYIEGLIQREMLSVMCGLLIKWVKEFGELLEGVDLGRIELIKKIMK